MNDICLKEVRFKVPSEVKTFHAHLSLIKESANSKIHLKIYHEKRASEVAFVAEYFSTCEIPDLIEVSPNQIDHSRITKIQLPSDKVIGIAQGTSYSDRNGSYTLLIFSEAIIYKSLHNGEVRSQSEFNSFYNLSDQSTELFLKDYYYSMDDIGSWKAESRNNNFKVFNDINYRFIILFPMDKSFHRGDAEAVISTKPTLQLKSIKPIDSKIAKALIKLVNFYTREDIDFFYSRQELIDVDIETFKSLKYRKYRNRSTYCKHADYDDIYHFISSIKNTNLFFCTNIRIYKYIDNFILASILTKEAKFMIYFSILEGIRNDLLGNKEISIDQNFTFLEKPEIHLTKSLKEVKSKIIKEQRSIFANSIQGKVTSIKRLSMKDQFRQYFQSEQISIDTEIYNINFDELFNTRHRIFHGSYSSTGGSLKELNSNLERMVSRVIRVLMKSDDEFDEKRKAVPNTV